MVPLADAYLSRGWLVVAPDLPHSRATPGSGAAEDFSISGHRQSLETVLEWVQAKPLLNDRPHRLGLAGHSIGALCAALLAPGLTGLHHLLAVSPALSGAALLDARRALGRAAVEALAREAPRMLAEMKKHDATLSLNRIAAPVAVISGSEDGLTPPSFARAYFAAALGGCFYAILPGQHHCLDGPAYRRAIDAALDGVGA